GRPRTFEVQHHKGPTCPELKSDYEVSHEPCWAKMRRCSSKLGNEGQEESMDLRPGIKPARQTERPA
ncbi:MAG TPA: hypothetical protein VF749_17955, partial [Candidatus Acidoferrum sp.]